MMKRILSLLLALALSIALAGCSRGGAYGIKTVKTLVQQNYSLAFRNNDPIIYYVTAAIEVLAAEGKVDELAIKWLGTTAVKFEKNADALSKLRVPENKTFIIGVDQESFPFVYVSNGIYWGFDIELAMAVADKLGWTLQAQAIEKENVYNELASGNIDCAWGGIALDKKALDDEKYTQFGPYISNDIVIAAREGASGTTRGKTLAIPATTEAKDALYTDQSLVDHMGNIIRLVGGTTECFTYLYSGNCDLILTDTTAIMYYNCH